MDLESPAPSQGQIQLPTLPEQIILSVIKKVDGAKMATLLQTTRYIRWLAITNWGRRGWKPRLNKSIVIDACTDLVYIENLTTKVPAYVTDYLGFLYAAHDLGLFVVASITINFNRYEEPLVQRGKLSILKDTLAQSDCSVQKLIIPIQNISFIPLLHPKEIVLELITEYPELSREILLSLEKLTMTGYNLGRDVAEQITNDILIHVKWFEIDFDDENKWHLVVPSYITKLADSQGINKEGRFKLKGTELPFHEEYFEDVDHAFLKEWTHVATEDDGPSWKRTALCVVPCGAMGRIVLGMSWTNEGDTDIHYKIFKIETELEAAKSFCSTFGNLEEPQMTDVAETLYDPFPKVDRMRNERLERQQRAVAQPTGIEAEAAQPAAAAADVNLDLE